jgi:hypothetical protein
LNRMLTKGFALQFRVDVRGLGLCHMRSMWESGSLWMRL